MNDNANHERWLPVPGFEGVFEVSDQGRVCRVISTYGRPTRRLRRLERIKDGYLRVSLQHHGKTVRILVHRLVAMAFLGNCSDKFEVNHKDGNKGNNAASNLEYVTPQENVRHSIEKLGAQRVSGDRHPKSKLSWKHVEEIRARWGSGHVTKKQIALEYRVSESTVGRAINGSSWRKAR